jgi:hypothetical protein
MKKRKKPKYKLGDTVILKNIKKTFQKGHQRRYNTEIYTVIEVDPIKPIPMYTIRSTDKDKDPEIEGRAYEFEIQLVDKPKEPEQEEPQQQPQPPLHRITIRKEVTHQRGPRRGKKSFLVSWEGFSSPEHDAWIHASDIEN